MVIRHLKVPNVPVELLVQRLVAAFQRCREPIPWLEQQGKVDLVVVRMVEVEVPGVGEATVVSATLDQENPQESGANISLLT